MKKKASKKRSKKGTKVKSLDTKINKLEKQLQTLKTKKKVEQHKVIVAYGIDLQDFVHPLRKVSKKVGKKVGKKVSKRKSKKKVDLRDQLKKGIEIETLEHGKRLAKKVAMDHLSRDPNYYSH